MPILEDSPPLDRRLAALSIQLSHRVATLMSAVAVDHPIILAHCTEVAALRIMQIAIVNSACVTLLKSSVVVSHLSDTRLVEWATTITTEEFEEVFTANTAFVERFNFELARNFLEKHPRTKNAKSLLIHASFLKRITLTEIPIIAKFLLIKSDAQALLKSHTFLNKLNEITTRDGKTACSNFLLSLVEHNHLAFAEPLIEDDHIFPMLTERALTSIAELNILAKNALDARRRLSINNHPTTLRPVSPASSSDSGNDVVWHIPAQPLPQYNSRPSTPPIRPNTDSKKISLFSIIACLLLIGGMVGMGLGIAGLLASILSPPVAITMLVVGVTLTVGLIYSMIMWRHRSRNVMEIASSISRASSQAEILDAFWKHPAHTPQMRQDQPIEASSVQVIGPDSILDNQSTHSGEVVVDSSSNASPSPEHYIRSFALY